MNPEPKTEQPRGGDPVAAETAQYSTTNTSTLTKSQRKRNREYEKQFPLARGLCIGNTIIVFGCPSCGGTHVHGWDPKNGSKAEEFRSAHCGGGKAYRISPFRQRDLDRIERRVKFALGLELPLTKLARVSKKYAQENAAHKAAHKAAKEGKGHGN
jgi:hypothetical protein